MSLLRRVDRSWWIGCFGFGLAMISPGLAVGQQVPGQEVAAAASVSAATQAQPADDSAFLNFFRKTEITGTADMYFHYNFNEPATGSLTPLRNFDFEHNQFSFALAEIAFNKAATADDRVGFRFDFNYGPVADWVHSVDPEGVEVVKHTQQAYISYMAPVGSGLTVDIGKFVTQHGTEVIEAKDNWNYSRSLLFSWAIPYYHMGIRLGYAPTDKVTLGGYIVNGWNNVKDNNSGKTFGAQALLKPTTPLLITLNYMAGPEQTDNSDDSRHLFDASLLYAVNETISVAGNVDYGRDTVSGADVSWKGIGLYAKAQANPMFALIPRLEWYDDSDGGFTTGAAQKVKEFTMTAEVKHTQGLIMRLEFRRDWSNVDFFTKGASPRDNQNTFSVGWVYGFSSRQ